MPLSQNNSETIKDHLRKIMFMQQESKTSKCGRIALHLLCATTSVLLLSTSAAAFSPISHSYLNSMPTISSRTPNAASPSPVASPRANTALNVWFFGGTDSETDDDSCELVAVRIERTSRNSRRIAGDIIIQKPMDDVWAILTDYDNLAIHVPNLVESRRVNPSAGGTVNGAIQGDGDYKCRLFQRGAQKIIGFEFGASVTMDMAETISNADSVNESRVIDFKCVDSQFFSEFDGQWTVTSAPDPEDPSQLVSNVKYVVMVRPKGPVPIQALEWRIENDVPTNLRAVKTASIDLGQEGVMDLRNNLRKERSSRPITAARNAVRSQAERGSERFASVANSTRRNVGTLVNRASDAVANATAPMPVAKLQPIRVDWYEDETMAAYLNKRSRR
mmetsp:Transcript_5282/g.7822  ORF Transcript_5282/g.7822 Transcript_5282/m.7822 type:complete len:390 (-) Transcript_5282:132-1301(-)